MTSNIQTVAKLENFIKRNHLKGRKALWRVFNDNSPNARAVYILGAQRSGTTMLIQCLEQSMEFEVYGESSEAMVQYRIRSDGYIRDTVKASHHRFVVFKPLTDSHRALDFLQLVSGSSVVWAFRRVEDRVNSSVAKFGDHNLQILRGLAQGDGLDRWQAQGLGPDEFDFIRSFDYSTMSAHVASALFWYLRNTLFFRLGLDRRADVLPLAYEDLASRPPEVMQGICAFLGAHYTPSMVAGIHAQSIGRAKSSLPQEIADLCNPLYERLRQAQQARWPVARQSMANALT